MARRVNKLYGSLIEDDRVPGIMEAIEKLDTKITNNEIFVKFTVNSDDTISCSHTATQINNAAKAGKAIRCILLDNEITEVPQYQQGIETDGVCTVYFTAMSVQEPTGIKMNTIILNDTTVTQRRDAIESTVEKND